MLSALSGGIAADIKTGWINFGNPPGNDVGQQSRGAASHGPAEGSVTGVEEQIIIARRADDWRAVRRHGAQAAPEFRRLRVAAMGKQVSHDIFKRVAPRLRKR